MRFLSACRVLLCFSGFAATLACGSSDSGLGGEPGTCTGTETRCSNNVFQECVGGQYEDKNLCANACSNTMGCVECLPEINTCVADSVHSCNADGTVGTKIRDCQQGCNNGSCGENQGCAAGGAELVYVVDDDYNFLSFDPAKIDTAPFTIIGELDCPAGTPLGGIGGTATPFSMSVDRNGRAWVLYNSGEIFHVSTANASCSPTSWTPGTNGFELFGMGFVSDSPGSNEETLFISGGSAEDFNNGALGNLATIDPDTLAVSTVGPIPNAEQSPELTGTGDAKLYAYFPGDSNSFVANLDKGNASRGESWNTQALDGGASAWAFAHWGGKFYTFATSGLVTEVNAVYELDPTNGETRTAITNSLFRIVGAGVSTCAPTQID